MSTTDRKIKNIDVRVKDANGKVKVVNLIEHDTVNLKYKDPETGKTVHVETGEIIKIGVHTNNDNSESIYLVVIAYNYYLENNVFSIPVSSLTQIITVNHSTTQYTITPVYTPDESVALLRSVSDCLEFTINGKDWIKCGGGSGSDITIDDVDNEIEKYIRDVPLVSEGQVDTKIAEATADFVTEETVTNIVDRATQNFVTETQVDSKIANATADFVTMSEVDSEIDTKVAEATADFITGQEVDTKITEATADFVTDAQVDTKITEATAEFVTMPEVDSEIDIKLVPYATLNNPTFTGDVKVPTVAQSIDDDTAASTSYVRDAIDDLKEELAGALHFKGVVATYEDLIAIENPEIGDVYQVTSSPAGENAEYVYTEQKGWIELGTVIDLSGYATLEELNRVADATLEAANEYTNEAIASIEDPYALCVAKGYQGTKDDFYTALTDILMHNNVIPTVDDLNS